MSFSQKLESKVSKAITFVSGKHMCFLLNSSKAFGVPDVCAACTPIDMQQIVQQLNIGDKFCGFNLIRKWKWPFNEFMAVD